MAEPRGCGDPDIYTAVQWVSAGSLNTQQPFAWADTALVPISQMQHGGTENQRHMSRLAQLVQGEDGLQSPTGLTTLLMVSTLSCLHHLPPVLLQLFQAEGEGGASTISLPSNDYSDTSLDTPNSIPFANKSFPRLSACTRLPSGQALVYKWGPRPRSFSAAALPRLAVSGSGRRCLSNVGN